MQGDPEDGLCEERRQFEDLCEDLRLAWNELDDALRKRFAVRGEVRFTAMQGQEEVEAVLSLSKGGLRIVSKGDSQKVSEVSMNFLVRAAGSVSELVAFLEERERIKIDEVAEAVDLLRSHARSLSGLDSRTEDG